jgi:hypothetical protein
MREPESAVIRWCEHGEDVRAGQSSHGCSGCVAGVCGAALACMLPESDPEPASTPMAQRLLQLVPSTPEGRGRAIGAALGLGGFFLFAREAYRLFFT